MPSEKLLVGFDIAATGGIIPSPPESSTPFLAACLIAPWNQVDFAEGSTEQLSSGGMPGLEGHMTSFVGRLFMVGAIMGVGMTAALAQANHFRGDACIVTASAGCAAVKVTPGYCYDARLRPANYNGQPNSTRLSLFVPFWTQNFTLPVGSLVGTTFKPVNATAIGQGVSQYNATARIPGMAPAAPTATTIFVTATIDINAFDVDAPSCNVRLRFQGQRFPMP